MAELTSIKQPGTIPMDQEDQVRKGDEYERRAANEVNGWAMFSGDYEKAIQMLEKAFSFYKPSKAFDKVAGAHMKTARCFLKMGNVEEGAAAYVTAAKYYKRINHPGAVTCFSRAAMLFEEIGQLSAAGRYYQELGDICDAKGKNSDSIGYFRKAAELYSAHESHALSNQCRTKVAKHAAELERYAEAIPIFEELARDAVSTSASKKTVKEMLLYAGLCYSCSFGGDGAVMKQALKGFQEIDENFNTCRESKIILVLTVEVSSEEKIDGGCGDAIILLMKLSFRLPACQYLATALEKRNLNLYSEVLNTHEVLFRNDALARLLANRGQKKLNCLPARSNTTKDHSPDAQQSNVLVD